MHREFIKELVGGFGESGNYDEAIERHACGFPFPACIAVFLYNRRPLAPKVGGMEVLLLSYEVLLSFFEVGVGLEFQVPGPRWTYIWILKSIYGRSMRAGGEVLFVKQDSYTEQ